MTWTQGLLQFFGWGALGAVIGSLFYALVRLASLGNPAWSGGIGVLGALVMAPVSPVFVLGAVIFCGPGAYAEKVIGTPYTRVSTHYLNLLSASMLGILAGIFLVMHVPRPLFYPWGEISFTLGLICTPSSVPLLRWLWRNSRTLPGVERQLEASDELS